MVSRFAATANAAPPRKSSGNRSFETISAPCLRICTTSHSYGRVRICGYCGYAEETGRRPVEEIPRSSKTAWPGLACTHMIPIFYLEHSSAVFDVTVRIWLSNV